MSYGRTSQLKDLRDIIQEISKEIMWVNDQEEEELMFDWGDKNIDQYIPRKQENYSVSVFSWKSLGLVSCQWESAGRRSKVFGKSHFLWSKQGNIFLIDSLFKKCLR